MGLNADLQAHKAWNPWQWTVRNSPWGYSWSADLIYHTACFDHCSTITADTSQLCYELLLALAAAEIYYSDPISSNTPGSGCLSVCALLCVRSKLLRTITFVILLNENNYQKSSIRCSILNEVGPIDLNGRSIEDCMHGLVQHYLHNDNGEIYHRNEWIQHNISTQTEWKLNSLRSQGRREFLI